VLQGHESPNDFSLMERSVKATGLCEAIDSLFTETHGRLHNFTSLDDFFPSRPHVYKNPAQVDILVKYLTKHSVFSTPIHHADPLFALESDSAYTRTNDDRSLVLT
jgi:hypothetical protein